VREELKGKRLAVFGANNVIKEVTRFAKANGIILISVGNVPEAEMHKVSDEQYYIDCTDETAVKQLFVERHIDGLLSCSGEAVIRRSVDFIERMGPKSCVLKDGREVLLSRGSAKEIRKSYQDYLFSRMVDRAD